MTTNGHVAGTMQPYRCAGCDKVEYRFADATGRRKVCSSCRGPLLPADEERKPDRQPQTRRVYPLTGWQVLVLAAYDLEERHKAIWTTADIAVAMFKREPVRFALEGYPEHCDSNKCLTILMSRKNPSLYARALVEKVAAGRYKLTELGRDEARRLVS